MGKGYSEGQITILIHSLFKATFTITRHERRMIWKSCLTPVINTNDINKT